MLSLACEYLSAKRHKPTFKKEDEESVNGKIIVVTGSNSGMGKIVALEMAKRGAIVVMACRDVKKAKLVLDEIKREVMDAQVILVKLDLGDLSSVRECAEEIKRRFPHVNILVNNAGVFFPTSTLLQTKDGFECHFGTNHLGHFLLTLLLLDHLKKGAPGRVVIVASSLHKLAKLDLDDPMLEKTGAFGFRYWGAYNNSKLANMYFAKSLAEKLEGSSVNVYSVCPGYVKTPIFKNEPCCSSMITKVQLALFGLSPEQGAETILYCALSKKCARDTGKMYHFNQIWEKASADLDPTIASKLWMISENLVGLNNQLIPEEAAEKIKPN